MDGLDKAGESGRAVENRKGIFRFLQISKNREERTKLFGIVKMILGTRGEEHKSWNQNTITLKSTCFSYACKQRVRPRKSPYLPTANRF